MPLFKLSSEIMPTIYQKDETKEATLARFRTGFAPEPGTSDNPEAKSGRPASHYLNHPTFKCEEITPEKFVEELPDEFQINDDTSF
jgi:hypothetical protein